MSSRGQRTTPDRYALSADGHSASSISSEGTPRSDATGHHIKRSSRLKQASEILIRDCRCASNQQVLSSTSLSSANTSSRGRQEDNRKVRNWLDKDTSPALEESLYERRRRLDNALKEFETKMSGTVSDFDVKRSEGKEDAADTTCSRKARSDLAFVGIWAKRDKERSRQ